MELNGGGEGVLIPAEGRTLTPGVADSERFGDGRLVRSFSVAKDRNQTQTSGGRNRNGLGPLWGQYGNDRRTGGALGRSQDSSLLRL